VSASSILDCKQRRTCSGHGPYSSSVFVPAPPSCQAIHVSIAYLLQFLGYEIRFKITRRSTAHKHVPPLLLKDFYLRLSLGFGLTSYLPEDALDHTFHQIFVSIAYLRLSTTTTGNKTCLENRLWAKRPDCSQTTSSYSKRCQIWGKIPVDVRIHTAKAGCSSR